MREIKWSFSRQLFSLSVGVLLLLAPSGCGRGVGQVSGKITLNGGPLSAAQGAVFFAVDNREVAGTIDNDENYTVLDVPVGAAKVRLVNPRPEASRRLGAAVSGKVDFGKFTPEDMLKYDPGQRRKTKPPPFVPPIPAKYESTSTSGLTFDVRPGQQTFNIDLKR
jgi:hypothetical protein